MVITGKIKYIKDKITKNNKKLKENSKYQISDQCS